MILLLCVLSLLIGMVVGGCVTVVCVAAGMVAGERREDASGGLSVPVTSAQGRSVQAVASSRGMH